MSEFRDVSELLSGMDLKVVEFAVDNYHVRNMRLASGQAVILGRSELIARVQRFIRVWDELLINEREKIKAFDARYDNGVAVVWR